MARSVTRQTFLLTIFFDLDGEAVDRESSRPFRRAFIIEANDESAAEALAIRRVQEPWNLRGVAGRVRILDIECDVLE